MSIINSKLSSHQNSPFNGNLSFVSGISSKDESQGRDPDSSEKSSDKELEKLREDLLLLIGELEEFVHDQD